MDRNMRCNSSEIKYKKQVAFKQKSADAATHTKYTYVENYRVSLLSHLFFLH
jgi:hypothetical protein